MTLPWETPEVKESLLREALERAGPEGLVLSDTQGTLGPMAFSHWSQTGSIKDGISIAHTMEVRPNVYGVMGGVVSREEAVLLHKWLSVQIARWGTPQDPAITIRAAWKKAGISEI